MVGSQKGIISTLLRTRRVLTLCKVYGISVHLALNEYRVNTFLVVNDNILICVSFQDIH